MITNTPRANRLTCPQCGSELKLENRNCSGCMGVEERVACKHCGMAAPWVACCSDAFCKPSELSWPGKKPSTKKRAYRAWKAMRRAQHTL